MRAHRLGGVALLASLVGTVGCGSETATSPGSELISPVTVSWTGIIAPGGTASRSFVANQSGTVTVTLTSSDAPLGIGIGVPRTATGGCRLTVSQVDAAGVSVSASADAGNYCVQLFDDGAVVSQAAFAVQIVSP
jgi:hypothetical protein